MAPIDLNMEESSLAKPFRVDIEPKLGLFCVGGGEVRCSIQLDRGGYVSGETISVSGFVKNASNVTIKSTKIALVEVSFYFPRTKNIFYNKNQIFY